MPTRNLSFRFAIVAAMGAAALACSSRAVNRDAGSSGTAGSGTGMGGTSRGGTTGNGGAGATGTGGNVAGSSGAGTGGAGGGNAGGTGGTPAMILPDCVTNLLASCEPQGACTSSSDAGVTAAICFASGVRVTYSQGPQTGCASFSNVTVVTKADGSPCYSFESYRDSGMACERDVYIWRDAAGQLVAMGVWHPHNNPSTRVSCSGGVESTCNGPATFGVSNPCCGITNLGTSQCMYASQQCTAGSCP
jgi:hypothetical protein